MIKLYRARTPLYRRQILQQKTENIRWTALDKIYKIYMLFQTVRFEYFSNNSSNYLAFSANLFEILQKLVILEKCSLKFAQIFMKIAQNFADILENVEHI